VICPNYLTPFYLSPKAELFLGLHKEIMALKGRIPRPSQNNNYLTFKRMMMLVVKKRKLFAAKNEILSDGPKSFSPETIKGAIEKQFPSSLKETRVGDDLTEVNFSESRFDTSAIQILSDDQRKDFYEKIILKINTKYIYIRSI